MALIKVPRNDDGEEDDCDNNRDKPLITFITEVNSTNLL